MCRAATPYAYPNTWSTSALGLRSARRAAAGAPLGSARLGATCACSGEWGGLCALALRRAVLTLSRSESVRYSGVSGQSESITLRNRTTCRARLVGVNFMRYRCTALEFQFTVRDPTRELVLESNSEYLFIIDSTDFSP